MRKLLLTLGLIWSFIIAAPVTVPTAMAGIIYVDADANGANDGSSWADAYNHLQDALAASSSDDEIWLAQGTYKPDQDEAGNVTPGDRYATFQLKNGVALYGGFPSSLTGEGSLDDRDPKTYETILSGDIDIGGGQDSYHVVTADDPSIGNSTILDGFTITGGRADGDWQLGYSDGAGIYCDWGSPTISNCVISGNVAGYLGYGGGMCNYCNNARVIDCTFSDNSAGNAGAGMINWSSEPMLINCIFSRNSTDGYAGGMFNWSSNPTLINCAFTGNSTTSDAGGGVLNYDSEPTLTNCVFSENSTAHHGGGMYIYDKSPKLVNCTFSGNSANHKGGGIYNYEGNPELTNCIFWGNTDEYSELKKDEQIYVVSGTPSVTYSCIQDDNPGDGDIPFDSAANKNIDDNPHFVNANDPNGPDGILATLDDGLALKTDSPCVDAGNNDYVNSDYDITGRTRIIDGDHDATATVDMGTYELPRIWYVDETASGGGTSWSDAFEYLQDALDVAQAGDQIWVAKGTYYPDEDFYDPYHTNDDRAETFQLLEGVELYGGFDGTETFQSERNWIGNETTLNGDLNGDDGPDFANNSENSYHIVTGSGTDQTAVLDGFTVTAGNASLANETSGGGMYNVGGSPTVTNCIFSGNLAATNFGVGGGMCNRNSSPTVTSCIFRDNTAVAWGGGMYNYNSSPTVTDCFFEKNKANFGGGMDNNCSSPTVVNCVFSENYSGEAGGGMYNYYKPTAKLVNCIFSGNYANNAGGGISNYLSTLTLVNCTFSGNSATNKGGAIENDYWDPKLTNCIIWGNYAPTDPEITNNVSHPRVKCCDIRGCGGSGEGWWDPSFGYDKGGNIDEDPCFVEPGYWDANGVWIEGDYHLLPFSPCIDAGDNTAVPPDTTDLDGDGNTTEPIPWDLDGNPRIVDGNDDGNSVVDMGAYEFSMPPMLEVTMHFTPQALNPGSKGNWVKAHFVLPEGFVIEDVDANTPAVIVPLGIESDYINVFINEDGLVELEIGFERAAFCAAGIDYGPAEVMAIGKLTSGQDFYGTDTIRIITNGIKYLAVLSSYWLESDCGAPDWCSGADLDQNTVVDFVDFALFDGCCIEVIKE